MPALGRYRAIKQLAAGGMGEVFLAEDSAPPQGAPAVVAIKRVAASVASDPELLLLFRHEAQLLTSLVHRHIVRVYEVGEDDQGCFVAMELVEGPSLRHLMQRLAEQGRRLPPALALDIAAQVGDALAFAYYARGEDGHPLRIIHRDVSPRNILVSHAGEVKLIDFGIAQSLRQTPGPGPSVSGKVGYLSPEQLAREPLNARSDLFSLGIVLCEMLTGRHPFERPSAEELAQAIRRERPRLPSASASELAICDPVILRLLAKRPSDRFADGLEVAKELGKLRALIPRPAEPLGELVRALYGVEPGAALEPGPSDSPGAGPSPAGVGSRASGGSPSPLPTPAPLSRSNTLRFFPSLEAQAHSLPETATDPQFPWIEPAEPAEPAATAQGSSKAARPAAAAPTAAVRIFVPHWPGHHGPAQPAAPASQSPGMVAVRFFPHGPRSPAARLEPAGEGRAEPAPQTEPTRPAVIHWFPPRKPAKAQPHRVPAPSLPGATTTAPGQAPAPSPPAVAGARAAPAEGPGERVLGASQGLAEAAEIATAADAGIEAGAHATASATSSAEGLQEDSGKRSGEPVAILGAPADSPPAEAPADAGSPERASQERAQTAGPAGPAAAPAPAGEPAGPGAGFEEATSSGRPRASSSSSAGAMVDAPPSIGISGGPVDLLDGPVPPPPADVPGRAAHALAEGRAELSAPAAAKAAPLQAPSQAAGEPSPAASDPTEPDADAEEAAPAQGAPPAEPPAVRAAEAPADSSPPLAPASPQLGEAPAPPGEPASAPISEGSPAAPAALQPASEPAQLESMPAREPAALPPPSAPQPEAGPAPARPMPRRRSWPARAVLAVTAAAGAAALLFAVLRGQGGHRAADGAARTAEQSRTPPATASAAAPEPEGTRLPAAALSLAPPPAPPPEAPPPPSLRPAPPQRRPAATRTKQAEAHKAHKPTARREEPAPRLARAEPPPQTQAPAAEPPRPEAHKPTFRLAVSGPGGPARRALSGSAQVQLLEAGGVAVFLSYRAEESALQATLTSEPWTIVAVDGVSVGKTPVALPDLAQRRVRLELRRPDADPISFELFARPEP